MAEDDFLGNKPIISILRPYSIGTVGANKDTDSNILGDEIEVVDLESRKFLDGELTDNVQVLEGEGTGVGNQQYSASVAVTSTIKAKWLSIGNANRLTAPNVRRGEEVMIYRLGTTDKYYWDTLRNHIKLRRLETVVYAFSAEANPSKEASIENENVYFFQISTHAKNVLFQTSQANGEPYGHSVQIDAANGKFIYADTANNYFTVESEPALIEMRNTEGTFFRLNGKDIEYYAPGNINGKSEGNNDLEVGGNNNMKTAGNTRIESQGTATLASPSSADVDSPNIGFMGAVHSDMGTYGGDGSMELKGRAHFQNSVEVDGSITAQGNIETKNTFIGVNLEIENKPWI